MPRKQRCRWIEGYPDHWEFSPEELSNKEPVVMTLDEFETIRLLDREGLTQEQCAEKHSARESSFAYRLHEAEE